MNDYVVKAKINKISFSSRASIKLTIKGREQYFTIEYGEERQIDNFDEINIDKERQALIDDCNKQVDNQIEEICRTFL